MKYELAKQLKDAGFPNSENWITADIASQGKRMVIGDQSEIYIVPTLSELIEACGTIQLNIYNDAKYSQALSNSKVGEGSTPEEAVANLWITLNKK